MDHVPRRRLATAGILALLLIGSSCGHQTRVLHGFRFSSDGSTLVLAARLPFCGCITIANQGREVRLKDGTFKRIRLKARLYNEVRGEMVLDVGAPQRLRFDWADLTTGNAYEIAAYPEPEPGQKPLEDPDALRPIWDYVFVDGKSLVESSCREQACPFGELAMNREYTATLAQTDVDVRHRGVTFTKGGQQLEVAARIPDPGLNFGDEYRCGCMILRNTSREYDVTLLATLGGNRLGTMELPYREVSGDYVQRLVAFDWAGPLEEDGYTITATAVKRFNDRTKVSEQGVPPSTGSADTAEQIGTQTQPEAPGVSTPRPSASVGRSTPNEGQVRGTAFRLADYVTVVGQVDSVRCVDGGSAFPVPGQLFARSIAEYVDLTKGKNFAGAREFRPPDALQIFQAECPFGQLGLSRAWDAVRAQPDFVPAKKLPPIDSPAAGGAPR